MTDHALFLLDHAAGHGNIKKQTVEITLGVITFGLVTCACIFIKKYPGKFIDIIYHQI